VRDFAWRYQSCAISATARFFARSYGCGLAGGTGHAPSLVFAGWRRAACSKAGRVLCGARLFIQGLNWRPIREHSRGQFNLKQEIYYRL